MKKRISIIFLVLVLLASAFLMCGPDDTTEPDDGGDGGSTTKYTLTINKTGNGSVTKSPDSADGKYVYGTVVSLTAVADSGWCFVEWQGDLTGSNATETITMDGDKIITAEFCLSKTEMVSVPGGTYTQEDTLGNSFSHTISAFSIGKYEVTYDLWYIVYAWATENGYEFANAGMEGSNGTVGAKPTDSAKYEPVTEVNWRDAIVWCNAYSEKSGFTPVYKSGGNVLKDSRDSNGSNCDSATADFSANGYRLPTEGEWQYAASYKDGTNFTPWDYASGGTVAYDNGSKYQNDCKKVAWYSNSYGGDSDGHTHAVGGKKANALGLHDMSGNVYEWCWDLFYSYPTGPQTDYANSSAGSFRVLRGSNWKYGHDLLVVGCRNRYEDLYNYYSIGFRLVRRP